MLFYIRIILLALLTMGVGYETFFVNLAIAINLHNGSMYSGKRIWHLYFSSSYKLPIYFAFYGYAFYFPIVFKAAICNLFQGLCGSERILVWRILLVHAIECDSEEFDALVRV